MRLSLVAHELRRAREFQSSPGLEAGCDSDQWHVYRDGGWFQSSPGLEAGCDTPTQVGVGQVGPVSILTRLGSRMRPPRRSALVRSTWFQSSPGLEAGCDLIPAGVPVGYAGVSILTRLGSRMRRPTQGGPGQVNAVSILTRLGSRMRRPTQVGVGQVNAVSILTRLGSRMRPPRRMASVKLAQFQSSPGLEAGCDSGAFGHDTVVRIVSILTRLGSRMRPQRFERPTHILARFNPHPAWKPDATAISRPPRPPRNCFNPHPAWKPDATAGVGLV